MKVVIDTSLFLVILPERSNDHDIFLALLNNDFEVCVTTDILFEYEEIVARKNGAEIARAALELLVSLPNVHFIRRYYQWDMVVDDPDDNKFTDCAVAANADYLVSDDRHFRTLRNPDFPPVRVIGKRAFRELLGLPV